MGAAVYTQTTDVEIEVNGMLTYDRAVVKLPPDAIVDRILEMEQGTKFQVLAPVVRGIGSSDRPMIAHFTDAPVVPQMPRRVRKITTTNKMPIRA